MIGRRLLVGGVLACAVTRAAVGQSRPKVAVVGVMLYRAEDDTDLALATLRRGLRDLGYVEGRDIVIEPRWADGSFERATRQAEELRELKVSVIVATTTPLARAAWNATRSIPIVASTPDSVALGFAESLARPGGNVTGISLQLIELVAKRLELLHEMLPSMSRVAFLFYRQNPAAHQQVQQLENAARKFGLAVSTYHVDRQTEYEAYEEVFASMAAARIDAVIVDSLLTPVVDVLVELGNKYRLPLASDFSVFAQAGGLLAVGADVAEGYGRLALYVDRILKGAKPSELPIEEPNHYVVVVNRKAAKALGIAVPESVLARADEVIE